MSDLEDDLQQNFKQLIQEHLLSQLGEEHHSSFNAKDYDVLITTYNSAVAKFYALSDILGIHGIWKERIHATLKWHKGSGCFDAVLI
jgi:hypothetical protein